jgi:hypothetical protein
MKTVIVSFDTEAIGIDDENLAEIYRNLIISSFPMKKLNRILIRDAAEYHNEIERKVEEALNGLQN